MKNFAKLLPCILLFSSFNTIVSTPVAIKFHDIPFDSLRLALPNLTKLEYINAALPLICLQHPIFTSLSHTGTQIKSTMSPELKEWLKNYQSNNSEKNHSKQEKNLLFMFHYFEKIIRYCEYNSKKITKVNIFTELSPCKINKFALPLNLFKNLTPPQLGFCFTAEIDVADSPPHVPWLPFDISQIIMNEAHLSRHSLYFAPTYSFLNSFIDNEDRVLPSKKWLDKKWLDNDTPLASIMQDTKLYSIKLASGYTRNHFSIPNNNDVPLPLVMLVAKYSDPLLFLWRLFSNYATHYQNLNGQTTNASPSLDALQFQLFLKVKNAVKNS
ncbi:MAG: hypothetical protein WBQ73_04005 [Candidatus Babeliales bacterium]